MEDSESVAHVAAECNEFANSHGVRKPHHCKVSTFTKLHNGLVQQARHQKAEKHAC